MRIPWPAIAAFALVSAASSASTADEGAAPRRGAKPVRATAAPSTARARPADAVLPGFETLPDGSTRLFVQLSAPVSYDAKTAKGSLTYVLKSTRVDHRNNTNPLVTVHFNTPVTSARLVPHGRDLWFVVALRADVQPQVAMDATKDGGALLRIDFPKGAYVPNAEVNATAPSGPEPPGSAGRASGSTPSSAAGGAPDDTGRSN